MLRSVSRRLELHVARMRPTNECPPRRSLRRILWSWVGSFAGIFLIAWMGEATAFDGANVLFLIGSFGASAVLVYGAPRAEFSQPRNLVGGHVLSAAVGVTVTLIASDLVTASSLSVSLAIAVMHLTRTLHPPGGASALIAVIGGEQVQSLGYWYVVSPVLAGACIMLGVALLVNNMSSEGEGHYPAYWV